jgi:hypothetical protein
MLADGRRGVLAFSSGLTVAFALAASVKAVEGSDGAACAYLALAALFSQLVMSSKE